MNHHDKIARPIEAAITTPVSTAVSGRPETIW